MQYAFFILSSVMCRQFVLCWRHLLFQCLVLLGKTNLGFQLFYLMFNIINVLCVLQAFVQHTPSAFYQIQRQYRHTIRLKDRKTTRHMWTLCLMTNLPQCWTYSNKTWHKANTHSTNHVVHGLPGYVIFVRERKKKQNGGIYNCAEVYW